jgi:hypothetical protein
MIDVSTLSFGAPAAERDISRGLAEYFVESAAFQRIVDGSKNILIGNRGTGKSAIFKVLARREREVGAVVIELAPEDYSYEMLSSLMAGESEGSWAKLGAYAAAWKYLIYLLVLKGITNEGPSVRKRDALEIYRYLRKHYPGQQGGLIGSLISYLQRIEGVKLGPIEASVKTRELEHLYRLDEIRPLLQPLRKVLEGKPVFVLVDELDRGWDASEDARSFVAGLFQACVSINDLSPDLRVCMSLRQELYDSIPELYEDAQKYRDLLEVISWDEKSLLKLIANRIRYSVPELRDAGDMEAWTAVFAETLKYSQINSFNYLVDRTLYRPREIIQFCAQSVELAEDRSERLPLDYGVISEAEISYSEERVKDIAAEYRFQYPGLRSVFETFRGRIYTMEREELESLCIGLALDDPAVDEGARRWVIDSDPDKLIEILWTVGFLRARTVGGIKGRRRSESEYLGVHQVGNLSLEALSRFQVQPMFRAYLAMKEPKGEPD